MGHGTPGDDAARAMRRCRPMEGRFVRRTRRVAYENPWITVWHDEVDRPDGSPGIYGVVHFANLAAGVVAIDGEDRVILVGQHRYSLDEYSWEIPEGGVPLGEAPLVGAQRELREETGRDRGDLARADAGRPVELGLRRARGPVPRHRPGARRRRRPIRPRSSSCAGCPFDEAVAMTLDGRITDVMSVTAIQRVALDRALADAATLEPWEDRDADLHVLRVFIGPEGRGGNPLGVFLDGGAIARGPSPGRRRRARLQRDGLRRRHRRRRPDRDGPHLHPGRGAAVRRPSRPSARRGCWPRPATPVTTLRLPRRRRRDVGRRRAVAGSAPEPSWVHDVRHEQLASAAAGRRRSRRRRWAPRGGTCGPGRTRRPGRLRARYFATDLGILEDEATGAAAVRMGDRLGRPLVIHQGVGLGAARVRPEPEVAPDAVDRRRARRGASRRAPTRPRGRDQRVTADRRDWDVIVVGLGAFGSAAAYWASTRPGIRVLGLERFELGHANGASADHSRIIRLSYHRPDYVRLAKRAYETWAEVQARGRRRPDRDRRPAASTCGRPTRPSRMADYTDSLAAEGVAVRDARRAPRSGAAGRSGASTTTSTAMWQAQGGLADPYRGNAAHRRLATARGAVLRDARAGHGHPRRVGGGYEVDAGGATYGAGRVVITADAWTNGLLASFDRRLPLTVTKEQVTYFAAPDPARLRPGPLPGLDLDGRPVVLRLPDLRRGRPQGRPGRAAARPSTRTTRTFERDEAAFARVARRSWPPHLPGALGPPILTRTCLYTLTPDRDFVVDRLPDAPGVVVGLGAAPRLQVRARCSGAILVELALDGSSPSDGRARPLPDRPADPARDRPGDVLDGLSRRRRARPQPRARHGAQRARSLQLSRRMPTFRALGRRLGGQARGWMSATLIPWVVFGGGLGCGFPLRHRLARLVGAVGLIAALLMPGAAPAAAAGGQVSSGRDDPGVRLDEPVPGYLVSSATRRSSSTTTSSSASARTSSPSRPASPPSGSDQDGNAWTFKIREGIKWSDGTPFTARTPRSPTSTCSTAWTRPNRPVGAGRQRRARRG